MFNVNVHTLFQWLFPWFLRTDTVVSFIYAFLTPAQRLYNDLEAYRDKKRLELSYNAQIMNLERLLNNVFNDLGFWDSIVITEEQSFFDMIYMGNPGTQDAEVDCTNPWGAGNSYVIGDVLEYAGINYICIDDTAPGILPTDTDYWEVYDTVEVPHLGNPVAYLINYNFIINIEQTFYDDLVVNDKINLLKALVNKYKIFGTKYTINPIYI